MATLKISPDQLLGQITELKTRLEAATPELMMMLPNVDQRVSALRTVAEFANELGILHVSISTDDVELLKFTTTGNQVLRG